ALPWENRPAALEESRGCVMRVTGAIRRVERRTGRSKASADHLWFAFIAGTAHPGRGRCSSPPGYLFAVKASVTKCARQISERSSSSSAVDRDGNHQERNP